MPPKKLTMRLRSDVFKEKPVMDWSTAVRIWNQRRKGDGYCIPRKGTKDYKDVQRIMRSGPRQQGF